MDHPDSWLIKEVADPLDVRENRYVCPDDRVFRRIK
jgi:hypothetical protein